MQCAYCTLYFQDPHVACSYLQQAPRCMNYQEHWATRTLPMGWPTPLNPSTSSTEIPSPKATSSTDSSVLTLQNSIANAILSANWPKEQKIGCLASLVRLDLNQLLALASRVQKAHEDVISAELALSSSSSPLQNVKDHLPSSSAPPVQARKTGQEWPFEKGSPRPTSATITLEYVPDERIGARLKLIEAPPNLEPGIYYATIKP